MHIQKLSTYYVGRIDAKSRCLKFKWKYTNTLNVKKKRAEDIDFEF